MSDKNSPIVIIEDKFTVENKIKARLEKEGNKVVSVKRSADIVKQLVSLDPSIIITDLETGEGKNPLTIVTAIKNEEKLKGAEIFVYCSEIDVKIEVGLRRLKIVSYFIKSPDFSGLLKGVKNQFDWDDMSQEYNPFDEMEDEDNHEEDAHDEFRQEKKAQLIDVIEVTQPENYAETEQFKDVLNEFHDGIDKQLENAEDGPEAYYNLGLSYYEMGLHEQALAQLEKSAKAEEWKIKSQSMIGAIYRKMGDHARAIAMFKACYQAVEDNFSKLGFRYEIADTLTAQGKLAEAYKMFATIYKVDKEYKDTRARLLDIKATLESQGTV